MLRTTPGDRRDLAYRPCLGPLDRKAATCRSTSNCSGCCAMRSNSGCWMRTTPCRPNATWPTDFAVSRITVRKAIDGLVERRPAGAPAGLRHVRRGRVEKNFSKLTSFSEDMRARGRTPRSVWLQARRAAPSRRRKHSTLRSSPGTPVYRFHRMRFADDAPMAVEYATIVAACLPSLEAVESSLYEALERAGNRPVRALQRLRAVLLDARAGRDAVREARRRGPAGRTARLPRRTAARSSSRSPTTAATPTTSSPSSARRGEPRQPLVPGGGGPLRRWSARSCARTATRSASLGRRCGEYAPRAVVTCARGSSDHAATYARYLIETRTGLLASSAAPSVSSLYAAKADLRSVLFVAISQSGASPDLLAAARAAKDAGALVVALVNAEDSPLARVADHTIPLRAGTETASRPRSRTSRRCPRSCSSSALDARRRAAGGARRRAGPARAGMAARLERGDRAAAGCRQPVRRRTRARPRHRAGSRAQAQGSLRPARRGIQLGGIAPRSDRAGGPRIPGARVRARTTRRGPTSNRSPGSSPASGRASCSPAREVPGALTLPAIRAHPAIEPLLLIQSFYRFANALALARGRDPDRPPHLRKVTETV